MRLESPPASNGGVRDPGTCAGTGRKKTRTQIKRSRRNRGDRSSAQELGRLENETRKRQKQNANTTRRGREGKQRRRTRKRGKPERRGKRMPHGRFYRREEAVERGFRLEPDETDGESLPGTALLRVDVER
jgi:hypothetical protein